MKKLYFVLVLVLSCTILNAQMLAWDFNGKTGDEITVTPSIADPDLAPTQISRGSVNPVALANAYNSDGWSTSSLLSDAIANNSYYQVTIQANAGYTVSLAGINANFRRTGSGPRLFQWMYSLDGTNFTSIGSPLSYSSTTTNGTAQAPIDLSTIPALDGVGSGTVITLRLYAYNASNASGQFALGRLFGNDLNITGTVTPIVIPIKLISFSAVNNKNITRLNWLVNCTSTTVTFQLLRGRHAYDMEPIYTKTETQARCASGFDLFDNATPDGLNLYRLKMIDVDGKASYSNFLQVNNKKNAGVGISMVPTVVYDAATLSIPTKSAGTATVVVYDAVGRVSRKMNITLFNGSNNVALNTRDLSAGTYHIKVSLPDGSFGNTVIVKQ